MLQEAEVWTIARTDRGNAVLVRPLGGHLAVPIFIGTLEAQNILLGMSDVSIPRPLTHDLTLTLLKSLGAELRQVEIHDLVEGTFFSRLIVQDGDKAREADARPSDALALAVRCHCPIYLEERLVQEVGIPLNSVKGEDGAPLPESALPEDVAEEAFVPPPEPHAQDRRTWLENELKRLVAEENYEEAARVRDQLSSLDG